MDKGEELVEFLQITGDSQQWGNAYHIMPACHIWYTQITVHRKGFGNYQFGDERHYVLFSVDDGSTTGTHYDVLTSGKRDQCSEEPKVPPIGLQKATKKPGDTDLTGKRECKSSQ